MAVGLLSTANLPQNLAEVSFESAIVRLMPAGSAPLFGLTSLLKSETATNIEHGYFSKTMVFPSLTTTAAALVGDTTLTVAAYSHIRPGDMVLNERTNEIMLVTGTPTTTTVAVQRAVGTTAAAAVNSGDNLRTIGNAHEQGSVRPSAVSIIAQRQINNTQIFRDSWALTKTMASIPLIVSSNSVSESRQDCAAFHAVAIEKALFFGERFMGTRNGQPFHTMDGVISRIRSAAAGNVTTLGATTNWTQLEAALDTVLNVTTDPKGGNIRTLFVGGTARRVIHAIARLNSTYNITPVTTDWGLQLDVIRTPRGTFELIEHPLFNAYGANSVWARMAVIIDLSCFSLAYLRKTSDDAYNSRGVQVDDGIDAEGGTLTTELTCLVTNPQACGLILNFTAGAQG